MIKDFILAALNFIYPLKCFACGNDVAYDADSSICGSCRAAISPTEGLTCAVCGVFLPDGGKHCFLCKRQKFHFTVLRSYGPYKSPLKELIHKLKYSGKDELGKELAFFLMQAWKRYPEIQDAQTVIPVPLHESSFRERGYNQSEVLAKSLIQILHPAQSLSLSKTLLRARRTESQTRFQSAERAKNVEAAFKVKVPASIKGKNILLIDDVSTTCSTLEECAKVLKKAGAKKVSALTLARNFV